MARSLVLWFALVLALGGCGLVRAYDLEGYELALDAAAQGGTGGAAGVGGSAWPDGSGLGGGWGGVGLDGGEDGADASVDVVDDSGMEGGTDGSVDVEDSGMDGGAGADGSDSGITCPPVSTTTMVSIYGGYQIDATEVTRGQYEYWLVTANPQPDTSGVCSWNTLFVPHSEWPPGDKCDHPVVGVNWCAARSYCLGQGKRMCGKIGGGSIPYENFDFRDASVSQWYRACSSNRGLVYPYGNAYEPSTCNGDGQIGDTVSVGSKSGCHPTASGYQGVFDLSGNVYEWEDSCESLAPAAECRNRGGFYMAASDHLRCNTGNHTNRMQADPFIGIRCCSD